MQRTTGLRTSIHVSLINISDRLAFFVELRLVDATGADVLPVLWSDNYVSLFPGDVMSLRATSPSGRALPPDVYLELRGVNVQPLTVPIVQDVAAELCEARQAEGVPDRLPEMPLDAGDGPAARIGMEQAERMVTSVVAESLLTQLRCLQQLDQRRVPLDVVPSVRLRSK